MVRRTWGRSQVSHVYVYVLVVVFECRVLYHVLQLSSVQTEVLALGLNFTPAPSTLPLNDFASAIESGACKLDSDLANDLRGEGLWAPEKGQTSQIQPDQGSAGCPERP